MAVRIGNLSESRISDPALCGAKCFYKACEVYGEYGWSVRGRYTDWPVRSRTLISSAFPCMYTGSSYFSQCTLLPSVLVVMICS
jgi:hypothetical protein